MNSRLEHGLNSFSCVVYSFSARTVRPNRSAELTAAAAAQCSVAAVAGKISDIWGVFGCFQTFLVVLDVFGRFWMFLEVIGPFRDPL